VKRRYAIAVDGREFTVDVDELSANRFAVSVDGDAFDVELTAADEVPGIAITPQLLPEAGDDEAPPVHGRAPAGVVESPLPSPPASAAPRPPARPPAPRPVAGAAKSAVTIIGAPIPGVILGVLVEAGATIARGDPIAVLEAMKMRNTIRASHPGRVVEVCVADGQPVGLGEPLVRLEPASG
jgi:biotin carboxyl carrier protein